MTLVTPLHLILFGAKRVQVITDGGLAIRLDGWINLQIDPEAVAKMLVVRSALDDVIAHLSSEPESVLDYSQTSLIRLITRLCEFHAAEYPHSPVHQVRFLFSQL